MFELTIFLARVLSTCKVSTCLLKCLLKISASSSLLLTVFLLLFQNDDDDDNNNNNILFIVPTVFQNFPLSETTL